nr:uncharacterized protein I303_03617 [Kwoniella dejecticola CBS 10117]OBR85902.1 hypothetical protein I303_03617 [Kwoniella dejecticola CBS 10117]
MGQNAVAGPSSEGAIPRKTSRGSTPSPPKSPSSAPPTPSVIAVTHPSQFIHTHHPRRGSLTPLGLNLISPVPPHIGRETSQPSFNRSVGFQHPWPNSEHGLSPVGQGALLGQRRGSAASTTSTLTQSRPAAMQQAQPAHPFYPPDWNPGRRRSSLTPSGPTLSAPSPSRTHISGKSSRPVSSDGSNGTPPSRPKHRAAPIDPIAPDATSSSPFTGAHQEGYARRGSLPHLGYGNWAGPSHRTWNPVLPPPRGSVGETGYEESPQLPNEGFKFGSVSDAPGISGGGVSPATAALRAVDLSPSAGGRRSSIRKRDEMDVFEQAEEAEAERQRRAFLAATYGEDGKRARERLSIGGQGGQGPPGTPAGGLRRQSLLLWERMGMARPLDQEVGPSSAPPVPSHPFPSSNLVVEGDLAAQRRGSLPIAIPGGGLGRSPSRRSARETKKELPSVVIDPNSEATAEEEEDGQQDEPMDEDEDEQIDDGQNLNAPLRPLPPLLPLSDPGPRLLPSTLALHRANHLLQSRNLQSDPLPHPLPPSLHPPAPVDVSEFDIDFILAGSQAQLGGQVKKKNTPIDILRTSGSPDHPLTPTLKLGGDEEDTFAKFVGEFDDEYGGRRGEWTFRACTSHPAPSSSPRDPLDVTLGRSPKAEWESSGAGKYELFPNGEVRSAVTGRSWRVYRLGTREYELEEVKSASTAPSSAIAQLSPSVDRYTLGGKNVHRDSGGVKLPHLSPANTSSHQPGPLLATSGRSSSLQTTPGSWLVTSATERKERLDSQASTVTMTPALSSSTPIGTMASLVSKKKKHGEEDDSHSQRGSVSTKEDNKSKSKGLNRVRSKESDPPHEGKKDKSFGGVLKRALKSSGLGGSSDKDEKKAQREERERERAQAHSWSGASNVTHQNWFSGSSRGPDGLPYKGQPHDHHHHHHSHRRQDDKEGKQRMTSTSAQTGSNHSATTTSSGTSDSGPWSSSDRIRKAASSVTSGEDVQMGSGSAENANIAFAPSITFREGKAWNGVPDEAVAMIIPLEDWDSTGKSASTARHPYFSPGPGPKSALLVWYVPFNAEHDDIEQHQQARASTASLSDQPSSAPSHSQSSAASSALGMTPSSSTPVGSLPKFQKLLRRRASRDNNSLRKDSNPSKDHPSHPHPSIGHVGSSPVTGAKLSSSATAKLHGELALPPLPFRSFRVVARVIDVQDLKSEVDSGDSVGGNGNGGGNTQTPTAAISPFDREQNVFLSPSTLSKSKTEIETKAAEVNCPDDDNINEISPFANANANDAKTVQVSKTGKTMPTVIAVCHSRSQGVEFVLEGLDRLGLCKGESAWGPTGYEEWRGTGLSEKGRELLDILWAGCTGVMGLSAS